MNSIKEKVSYIRGLSDGLDINDSSKEGKVIKAIINVLDEIADSIEDMDTVQEELNEYVEAIDEDLADVEEFLYEEDEDDDDEEDDDGFVEVECPNCHETVYLDEDLFDDEDEEITCPNCHEPIHFECDCCSEHNHKDE